MTILGVKRQFWANLPPPSTEGRAVFRYPLLQFALILVPLIFFAVSLTLLRVTNNVKLTTKFTDAAVSLLYNNTVYEWDAAHGPIGRPLSINDTTLSHQYEWMEWGYCAYMSNGSLQHCFTPSSQKYHTVPHMLVRESPYLLSGHIEVRGIDGTALSAVNMGPPKTLKVLRILLLVMLIFNVICVGIPLILATGPIWISTTGSDKFRIATAKFFGPRAFGGELYLLKGFTGFVFSIVFLAIAVVPKPRGSADIAAGKTFSIDASAFSLGNDYHVDISSGNYHDPYDSLTFVVLSTLWFVFTLPAELFHSLSVYGLFEEVFSRELPADE